MSLYPAAVKRLIPPGATDPRITPRVAILHVDAGNTYDLHDYFATRSGGIESHFHIAKDGTVFQYRDTAYQADANMDANDFAISIETQGLGAGEWTPAQLASIKALLLWLNKTHGIPLVKCEKWNGSGVGYHILFMQRWAGAPRACPGPDRIKQFDNVLVPWMASAKEDKDWFDMASIDDLRAIIREELERPEHLQAVARYVNTGYVFGPEGDRFVLAGHITQIKALAAADLTPEQVAAAAKAGAKEAIDEEISSATVVLTQKES